MSSPTINCAGLVRWPILLTFAMFPILAVIYRRLAKIEEADAYREWGEECRAYAARVPAPSSLTGLGQSIPSVKATV